MNVNEIIEHYRKMLKEETAWLMALNGHNFEEAQLILESALDFALNDTRNEIYK
jgi:hypothetical protein